WTEPDAGVPGFVYTIWPATIENPAGGVPTNASEPCTRLPHTVVSFESTGTVTVPPTHTPAESFTALTLQTVTVTVVCAQHGIASLLHTRYVACTVPETGVPGFA